MHTPEEETDTKTSVCGQTVAMWCWWCFSNKSTTLSVYEDLKKNSTILKS